MNDEEIRTGTERPLDDELASELRRLRPLLERQRRASTERLDDGFKRALRAQLTGAPQASPSSGVAAAWRTLVAMLLPPTPQLALRGDIPRLTTYTAGDVTISLMVRPSDRPASGLITVYGEVDQSGHALDESAGATVEALRGDEVVATTELDELGNFVLADLSPRVYALRLRFPDRREVIVPPTSYDMEGEVPPE